MSYAIYKTEAIIMRTIPSGEASSDVVLFTRDLGKITARVQSARKIESTMRMHLTKYNHVTVDVIRGKNTWRLVGINTIHPPLIFKKQPPVMHGWYRMISLAEYLIRGEEEQKNLFDFFIHVLTTPLERFTEGLELFGVITVLDMLGYWNGASLGVTVSEHYLQYCIDHKKELVKMINESIEATQIVV